MQPQAQTLWRSRWQLTQNGGWCKEGRTSGTYSSLPGLQLSPLPWLHELHVTEQRHVASHTIAQPFFQSITVAPSGLFPSERMMPDGSKWEGIFADARDYTACNMPWYEYIRNSTEFYYVSLSFILHCFHLNVLFNKLQFINLAFKT